MTWLLLSGDLVDARKAPHGFLPLEEKRDRVRLSLEQDLNAVNDRAGHCTTESLRDARGLRLGEFRWDGIVGRSLDGLLVSFAAVLADWWIDVAGRSSFSIGSFGCLPWFDFSLESELVFLAEIPAAVPDGLSVPVVRSGNTGKSRFLEASLALAAPIPFQDSRPSVPIADDLFQLGSVGARLRVAGPTDGGAEGAERVLSCETPPRRNRWRLPRSGDCSDRRSAARTAPWPGGQFGWPQGCRRTWPGLCRSTSG